MPVGPSAPASSDALAAPRGSAVLAPSRRQHRRAPLTTGGHVHLGVDGGDRVAPDDPYEPDRERDRRAAAIVRGLAVAGSGPQVVVRPGRATAPPAPGDVPEGVREVVVGAPGGPTRRHTATLRAVRRLSVGRVLHLHVRGLGDLPLATAAALTATGPVVLHLHGAVRRPVRSGEVPTLAHKLVGAPLEPRLLHRADLVVAPCAEVAAVAAAAGAATVVTPPAVLPLPAPLPDAPARPLPEVTGRRLVGLGPLLPHRRTTDLVATLAGLDPNVELVLLGTGSDRLAVDREARRAGLGDRVHVLPRVSWRTVHAHLVHAEVVVSAALVGDDTAALLTATAIGAPVVATRTAATTSVLTDGLDARLVPPADVPKLRTVVRELLDDRALAATLAASGRRRTAARGWDDPARRLLDTLAAV